MSPLPKLAAFAVALAAVFGIATLAGATVGPDRDGDRGRSADATGGHGMDDRMADGRAGDDSMDQGHATGGSIDEGHAGAGAVDAVRGLATSSNGLTVALDQTAFEQDRRTRLAFRIVGRDGSIVRDFDVEHERRMHLIVVRRDGSGFQHLHPRLGDDGTWSVDVTLGDPGAYRLFADFSHDGEPRTLGADLSVDGAADYRPLPAPVPTARTGDGYEVRLAQAAARAGRESELRFEVTRDGDRVQPQPYLGARGHLVALRQGDLAFLHVHPDEDSLAFMATFPSAGRYRLYLQFKHAGRVHTAEFTQEVER